MTVGSMRLAASEEVFETRHRAGREMEGRKKKGAAGEKKLSNLDAETGLAPVPPLGVVSVVCVEKERHLLAHFVPTEFCMWWLDLICGARSCYKFISENLIRRTDRYIRLGPGREFFFEISGSYE